MAAKRSLEEIDAEIAQVKKELEDVHGTPSEVYTRIVGYYRSVRNWNKGKREEYEKRKLFKQNDRETEEHLPEVRPCCGNEAIDKAHIEKEVSA